jgi:CBS domain containing-hemolysin-like protein
VVLLAGNAFFVGAEFAIVSSRRSAIEPRAAAGERRAQVVLWAMEHVALMLAATQLGVTVCSTGLGIVAEPAVAAVLERPVAALGVPHGYVHPIAFVIALTLVVYLHAVLGEMVPKNLAVAGPERAVLWFAPPLVWFARALRPVIVGLNWCANQVVRLTGVEPKDEITSSFTAQEVQSIVEHSQAEGVLRDEQGLLESAIEFSARTAGDVMIDMADLVTLREGVSPDEVEHKVARTGFSRFPFVGQDDRLIGYLHLKDVLYATDQDRHLPVPAFRVRALASVRPDDEVEDALRAMQRTGAHLARVESDTGTVGVVFLEDILEELVGEVRDAMQRNSARGQRGVNLAGEI